MRTVNIDVTGVQLVGNTSPTSISIENSVDENITYIKSCVNGQWSSWTKGTPEEYQGFTTLESGQGYIIRNSDPTVMTLPDGQISYEELNPSNGVNIVAIPKEVSADDETNWVTSEIKTVKESSWSSWTKGTPDDYQGFTTLNPGQGYLMKITDTNFSASSYMPYTVLGLAGYFIDTVPEIDNIEPAFKYVLSTRRQNY